MNGAAHRGTKLETVMVCMERVWGRRDAAPLPVVSFFGSAAAGFWRRVFNLNTSISRKEMATERDWTGMDFAGMHCLLAHIPRAAAACANFL